MTKRWGAYTDISAGNADLEARLLTKQFALGLVTPTQAPYNAPTDGTTDATAAILAAAAAVGTSGRLWFGPGRYRITGNPVLTCATGWSPLAIVVPDAGATLTIGGTMDASPTQHFDLSAGGLVLFAVGMTNPIMPQWWGATFTASGDDSVALQRWLTAALTVNSESKFPASGIANLTAPVSVAGPFYGALTGSGFSFIRWLGAPTATMLKITASGATPIQRLILKGLWLKNNNPATAGVVGLELGEPNGQNSMATVQDSVFQYMSDAGARVQSEFDQILWLNNLFIQGAKGIHLKSNPGFVPSSNHTILHNYFHEMSDWAVQSEWSALLNIFANTIQRSGTKGTKLDAQGMLNYIGNYHELVGGGAIGLSINATNGDGGANGAAIIGGNVFNLQSAASVGIVIGAMGAGGVKIEPNTFFGTPTAIRLLPTAPQEISIDPQCFVNVTTQIDDQRPFPSRAFTHAIGGRMASITNDPFATVVANGSLCRCVYKLHIPKETWRAAALTQDVLVGLTDARQRVLAMYVDTTQALAGPAGTLTFQLGNSLGGQQWVLGHDVKTAPVTKGLADADMGTLLQRANMVQGAAGAWLGDAIYMRLTSSAGNFGNGVVTSLTAGSIDVYVIVERLP
jgi:hypothetical protein